MRKDKLDFRPEYQDQSIATYQQMDRFNLPKLQLYISYGKNWLHSNIYQQLLKSYEIEEASYVGLLVRQFQKRSLIQKVLKDFGFEKIPNIRDKQMMERIFYYLWGVSAGSMPKSRLTEWVHKIVKQAESECQKESIQDKSISLIKPESQSQSVFLNLFQANLAERQSDRLSIFSDVGYETSQFSERMTEQLFVQMLNCERISKQLIQKQLKKINPDQKVLLQEILQLAEKMIPKYQTTSTSPFFSQVKFTVADVISKFKGGPVGSKKNAEREAARKALDHIIEDSTKRVMAIKYILKHK